MRSMSNIMLHILQALRKKGRGQTDVLRFQILNASGFREGRHGIYPFPFISFSPSLHIP